MKGYHHAGLEKNRAGSAPERAAEPKSDTRSYLGGLFFSRALATLIGLYLLVTIAVGWYWSQEPALFPVQQNAQAAAEKDGRQMVVGYTTVETLKTVAGTLLSKPGGYISNDRFPPGLWMDNMPSWEYGVLVQVRDLSRALRKDFARSQSQSAEDADLAKAEPRFNFDNRSWVLPSSESEYQEGINSLSRYQARLSDPSQKKRTVLRPRRQPEQLAGGMSALAWVRCPSACRPALAGSSSTPR
nr:hypothetical protein GCM10020185_22820 [Pseudomonas brassicacearum subsp. brassicacearum]